MRLALPVLCALLCMATAHAQAPLALSLKADALVTGARVRLAEVALLDAAGPAASAELGAAPLPGYTARFTRKDIERRLRASGIAGAIAWSGAEAVRVERAASPVDGAALLAAAEAHLRHVLRPQAQRVQLQPAGAPPDLQVPAGTVGYAARPITAAQALHGNVTVWVDVTVDGVFFRTVAVPFQLQAYRVALVAARDLPAGAAPQCADVQNGEVDLTAIKGQAAPADCAALRGHLKRPLTQGAALLAGDLHTPHAVAQGDSVRLQLRDGALVLESRAVALSDGEVGQRVEVRPSAATAVINAEVAGPGLVKVTGR